MIGLCTALIGDLAALFGCVIDMPREVTAITFVALGTSLPDTLASKTAAVQDPHADASLGNVTGSNSVNVFLGLGFPWMVGSIYWSCRAPDAKWLSEFAGYSKIDGRWTCDQAAFVVKAGSLGPSVLIFTCCAMVTILILYIRRHFLGGELGGPQLWARVTSLGLCCLWIFYIGLSSHFALNFDDKTDTDPSACV